MKTFRISCRKFIFQWSLIIQNNILVLVPLHPLKNCISPPGVIFPYFGTIAVDGGMWLVQTEVYLRFVDF